MKNKDSNIYFPYIDGLRAIAVLAVIFYHAGVCFTGGYVGVDIFFVISGYLITQLILRDLQNGRFSFIQFLERRVRRILPALLVVVIFCLVTGWLIFLSSDFRELGESVCAQSLLASNFYFWIKSGYFEKASEVKPLLHTWSLAVEEQFYLLFPFFLTLIFRFCRGFLIFCLLFLGVFSFALSIYFSSRNPSLNFYLLPTRAWELLIGSCIAVIPNRQRPNKWASEILSCVGLLAICIAIYFYDRTTHFAALLPCVGVALIIFSNRDIPTLSGKILSIRPLVFVGLISYSLYLWHWPILVFVKYRFFDYKLEKYGLPMLLGTFVLSFFTWKFVESPFRKQAILKSRKQIFTYAGIFTAVLFISGLTIHWMIGLPPDTLLSRRQLTEESAQNEKEETSNINTATQNMESAARYAEGENDRGFRIELTLKQALAGEFIELGDGDKHAPIELFVSGDSHAMSVLSIIDVLCKEYHVRGVAATHSSTIPLVDYDSHGDNSLYDDSIPFQKAILDFIRNQHVRDVLFVSYWSAYASQGQTLRIREGVFRTINAYSESGVRLWFMKPVPKPPWNVPRFLYSAALQGQNPEEIGLPLTEHRKIEPLLDQIFGGVDAPRVTILDPTMCFVNSNQLCRVARGGRSLYWDDNHLSSAGALELRPLFKQIFRAIVIGK